MTGRLYLGLYDNAQAGRFIPRQGAGAGVSIGCEPLTRIGFEELTTLEVEALERQGWRRAAKHSAVRLGAAAC
jgi:hypothetical protein